MRRNRGCPPHRRETQSSNTGGMRAIASLCLFEVNPMRVVECSMCRRPAAWLMEYRMGERSGGGRHCLYQGKEEGRLRLALSFLRGGHHAQGTIPSIRLHTNKVLNGRGQGGVRKCFVALYRIGVAGGALDEGP